MKIIFVGFTPVHAALLAANIYLGRLPASKSGVIEGWGDLSRDKSRPLYIGTDAQGTEVYTLGGGKDLWMVKKSLEDLRDILGFKTEDLIIETVPSRWDRFLSILIKIPPFVGGVYINCWVSKILLHNKINELNRSLTKL